MVDDKVEFKLLS
jgi:hypothetical protein